jgi:hypothetical protein
MSEYACAGFTDPKVLRRAGREAIVHFFGAFAADPRDGKVELPDPNLPDDEYYREAARLLEAHRRRQWLSARRLPFGVPAPGLTLEPLRALGPDALVAQDPRIIRIRLCEIRIVCNNGHCHTRTCEADDLFEGADSPLARHPAIPKAGRLTRATVRIQFAESAEPRSAVLCPPHTVQLMQAADAEPVKRWLEGRGFLAPETPA